MMRLNLKAKLLILMTNTIVFIVVVVGLFTISRARELLDRENHRTGLALANDVARYSSSAIISRDVFSLLKHVRHTMKQDHVTHVIILDPDGKVLAHS